MWFDKPYIIMPVKMNQRMTDILVVGVGLAGLMTAPIHLVYGVGAMACMP